MGYIKKKFLGLVFALFVLAISFVLLSIVAFYRVLQQKETVLQEGTLYDLSQFTSNYMDVKLEGYLNTLHGLSDLMLLRNVEWPVIRERLNAVAKSQQFQHIGLSSLDGVVWATDGKDDFTIDISGRDYWKDLLAGKSIITDAQDSLVSANQIFVVAVPMVNRDGGVVGVIHGAVSLNEFQGYEAGRVDMGNYLVFVVDRTGAFILRDAKHTESWDCSTIFQELAQEDSRGNAELIRSNLQAGTALQTEARILGKDFILCFSPLTINDWYTVVLMPKDEISKHISSLLDTNINILMVCVIVPLLLLCVLFIFFMKKEINVERNKEFQLREKLFSDIEGFIQIDLNEDRVIYCSQSLDLPEGTMPFSHLMEIYVNQRIDQEAQGKMARIFAVDNLFEIFSKGIARVSQEYRAMDKREKLRWFQSDIHMENDFETGHVIVYLIIRNIDEKKRLENALKVKAERDALTGLYNRSTATDLINVFLHLHTHDPKATHAFVILDLDNFKVLNDTLLHKTGDKALQDVAQILTTFFRKEDVVCRLGGDEFVVFLKNISCANVESKLSILMEKLRLTYTQEDKSVTISASAGFAVAPDSGATFQELYTAADQALYQAKHGGKSTFRQFHTS